MLRQAEEFKLPRILIFATSTPSLPLCSPRRAPRRVHIAPPSKSYSPPPHSSLSLSHSHLLITPLSYLASNRW